MKPLIASDIVLEIKSDFDAKKGKLETIIETKMFEHQYHLRDVLANTYAKTFPESKFYLFKRKLISKL